MLLSGPLGWRAHVGKKMHVSHACPPSSSSPPPKRQVRRALAWQLPPRAFFAAWCGGMSVSEALGVVGWLGLNAFWLVQGLVYQVLPPEGGAWQDRLNS